MTDESFPSPYGEDPEAMASFGRTAIHLLFSPDAGPIWHQAAALLATTDPLDAALRAGEIDRTTYRREVARAHAAVLARSDGVTEEQLVVAAMLLLGARKATRPLSAAARDKA